MQIPPEIVAFYEEGTPPKRVVLLQIARLAEHEPAYSPHMVAVARKP